MTAPDPHAGLRQALSLMARYHLWATSRLLMPHVADLEDRAYRQPVGLFFGSVHGTLNHLWLAERAWWGRFVGQPEAFARLDEELEADREALATGWLASAARWQEFIDQAPAEAWSGELHYRRINGQTMSLPWAATLQHVFNHATHHRGQITAALTTLGRTSPELDLVYMLQAEARGQPSAPAGVTAGMVK
jgi:uncharacterized damage-inducible protein DinB